MKRFLICAAALLVPMVTTTSVLASDVGISVSIGQPGFYGQLNIGGYAPPPVINTQPIFIGQMPPPDLAPIYLRVPPGHQRHWDRYCMRYNACHQRVFFVRDDWYTHQYAPRYLKQHGNRDRRNDFEQQRNGPGPRDHQGPGDNRGPRDNQGPRDHQGPRNGPGPQDPNWDNGRP